MGTDNARYRFLPGTTAERVIHQAWECDITKLARMRAWLLCVVPEHSKCVERGSTLPGLKKRVQHLDCRRLPKRLRVPQVARNPLEAWPEIVKGGKPHWVFRILGNSETPENSPGSFEKAGGSSSRLLGQMRGHRGSTRVAVGRRSVGVDAWRPCR